VTVINVTEMYITNGSNGNFYVAYFYNMKIRLIGNKRTLGRDCRIPKKLKILQLTSLYQFGTLLQMNLLMSVNYIRLIWILM
jgi:hypothetical protein